MTDRPTKSSLALALICLSLCVLGGCGALPPRGDPAPSSALPPTQTGTLYATSERIHERLDAGESAFWLLDEAAFSFDVRLALVDEAESSLDIQYFIWERDPSARLYAHRLLRAADRGVRVRLLLDDLTLKYQDREFYALAQHPNIEVRTFNPWTLRSNLGRVAEFVLGFGRLNHRMHNKIVAADGHFAIIGGRNIGDRYFGVWDEFVQNDLDIMASGPAADEVVASFDLYWNSAAAYPVETIVRPRTRRAELDDVAGRIEDAYLDSAETLTYFPLQTEDWSVFLDGLVDSFVPGVGHLAQDLPILGDSRPRQLYYAIKAFLETAQERVLVSSPYLILDDEYEQLFADLVDRGVEVVILTNSLATNNHMLAHSGYRRWRKRLLRRGVELYEARMDSPVIEEYTVPPAEPAFLGLHSKAFVVDDRYSFVGSPNLDPRSLVINTELGFFIESPELAAQLTALFERDTSPEAAWKVSLERRKLRWTSSAGTVKRQPARGFKQRFIEFFIHLVPFKKQA